MPTGKPLLPLVESGKHFFSVHVGISAGSSVPPFSPQVSVVGAPMYPSWHLSEQELSDTAESAVPETQPSVLPATTPSPNVYASHVFSVQLPSTVAVPPPPSALNEPPSATLGQVSSVTVPV